MSISIPMTQEMKEAYDAYGVIVVWLQKECQLAVALEQLDISNAVQFNWNCGSKRYPILLPLRSKQTYGKQVFFVFSNS